MELNGFPEVSTVESLFLWSAVALDNKSYPAQQLNDAIAPTSPISIRLGRVSASGKFNAPYVRITADLPLDSDKLNTIPLYAASQELVPGDSLPAGFSDGLLARGTNDGTDGGRSSPSLYTLPFAAEDYHFWFAGEMMNQALFGSIQLEDVNGATNGTTTGGYTYLTTLNGNPGFIWAESNSVALTTGDPIPVTEFSFIVCLASVAAIYSCCLCQMVKIGRTVEIRHPSFPDTYHDFDLDEGLHVFHVCANATSADFYLDGQLIYQVNANSALVSVDFDVFFNEIDHYEMFCTDFILLNRKITSQEIADSYQAIATHRGVLA